MRKGKAFILVGHRHWGKSQTLTALAGGQRPKRFKLNGTEFRMHRMSNRNDPRGFAELLDNTYPDSQPQVVLVMCPTFMHQGKREFLLAALDMFRGRYDVYFFVLRHQYRHPKRQITDEEIRLLKTLGKVKVFGVKADPETRAKSLRRFILANVAPE